MRDLATFDFVVLTSGDKNTTGLRFYLEQLNKLDLIGANVNRLRAIIIPVTEEANNYLNTLSFKNLTDRLDKVQVIINRSKSIYATEPRAFNLGLLSALKDPSKYIVFTHETDVILDPNLLSYYLWLFTTAHNPEIIGGVTFKTNTLRRAPSDKVKMFYADDVYLRGTCFKTEAILGTGPFDEYLIYRAFEFDFASRMSHHDGWLIRSGKEDNTFLRLGPTNLNASYAKLAFLKKQSLVWHAKKWYKHGLLFEDAPNGASCFLRFGTYEAAADAETLRALFRINITKRKERFEFIYSDIPTKKAIEVSSSFIKKPFGTFQSQKLLTEYPIILNNTNIQTHVNEKLEYPNLLWEAAHVY